MSIVHHIKVFLNIDSKKSIYLFQKKNIEDFTYIVSRLSFNVNGTNKIKENLNLSSNLINFETNTESGKNTISDEIF